MYNEASEVGSSILLLDDQRSQQEQLVGSAGYQQIPRGTIGIVVMPSKNKPPNKPLGRDSICQGTYAVQGAYDSR